MQIHVYDTHVKTLDGRYLHFDVLVNEDNKPRIEEFVARYLDAKGIKASTLTSASCLFCHSEVASAKVQASIRQYGYYILPLSGC
ncbi:DUF2024 family protein [Alteromonas gracilis]|uniref:DUF2024 family protein n=1 Tax=Alteromonas gracilis TaxID=1479524 RepID=UPI0037362380